MATKIVVNAKTQRPSVCNAAESLVVHAQIAAEFLPKLQEALKKHMRLSLTNEEITLINMLTVCELIVVSALQREESIGGHYRSDYPDRNIGKKEIVRVKKTTTCVMRGRGAL